MSSNSKVGGRKSSHSNKSELKQLLCVANPKNWFDHTCQAHTIELAICLLAGSIAIRKTYDLIFRNSKRKEYILESLRSHRLGNSFTKLQRKWFVYGPIRIKYPGASIEQFKTNILFLTSLFKESDITDVIDRGDNSYELVVPTIANHFDLQNVYDGQIGWRIDGTPFISKAGSILNQTISGGGKSIQANNHIYFFYKAVPNSKTLIADSHGTFRFLTEFEGIHVFDTSTQAGKISFLTELKNVRATHQAISFPIEFETLVEAQRSGLLMEIPRYHIVVDEFLENYGNSKDKTVQETLTVLTDLVVSLRKYSSRLLILTQAQLNNMQAIPPSLFHGNCYSYLTGDLAKAKDVPMASHPILKNRKGTFWFDSKFEPGAFLLTSNISKEKLVHLLRGGK